MKPRELYSGAAPQAVFAQMGQGLAEAGAKLGQIEQQKYQALGDAIKSGITTVAGAAADYSKMKSSVKAGESFFNSMKESGYLPEKFSNGVDSMIGSEAYKNMGTSEKAAYWDNIKQYAGGAIGQAHKLDAISAEGALGLQRTGMSEGAATGRTMLTNQAESERLAQRLKQERELGTLDTLMKSVYGKLPDNPQSTTRQPFSQSPFGIGSVYGN